MPTPVSSPGASPPPAGLTLSADPAPAAATGGVTGAATPQAGFGLDVDGHLLEEQRQSEQLLAGLLGQPGPTVQGLAALQSERKLNEVLSAAQATQVKLAADVMKDIVHKTV